MIKVLNKTKSFNFYLISAYGFSSNKAQSANPLNHPQTKTLLKFKDTEHSPIHINIDAQNFGKSIVNTFLKTASPLFAYYIIYLGFGVWSTLFHRLCLITFLAYPIIKCNNLIKILDITVKELHADKNGKDLIVVLEKGLMSGIKAYNKQEKEFEPFFRYTRSTSLYLRFKYEDIKEISLDEKKKEILMYIKAGDRYFNARIDLSKHKDNVPLDYLYALCRRESFIA